MRLIVLSLWVWLCHANTDERSCQSPVLEHGFLVPEKEQYDHKEEVSYSCNTGFKPALETWWGKIACNNGQWSHTPHCINITDCITPDVPHAKPVPSQVSFSDKSKVDFVCDKGFEFRDAESHKVVCERGKWTKLPVCSQKTTSCRAPNHSPNVMIKGPYRDVFEEGETIEYLCEQNYEFERKGTRECVKGGWSQMPSCVPSKKPAPDGGSDEVKPVFTKVRDCGAHPTVDHGRVEEVEGGWSLRVKCDPDYKLVGSEQVMCVGRQWSIRPTCVAESLRPAEPSRGCDVYPTVKNGVFFELEPRKSIRFECATLYKRLGPERVRCVNGQWSVLPVCKAPCKLDLTRLYYRQTSEYMEHGEKNFKCSLFNTVAVHCDDGKAYYRGCDWNEW
ncbi:complement factor H-related protein 5-like isoform X2 [Hoplias malabaricus]|uniref:complement factor H-related protein 5-like isoform X2 n=1 Tax=Hoplias malabaricus TaxID=27720 RepID=UPI003462BEAF